MIDLQELRKLAEAASNLFPDKWEENDEEVVSGGLTISCVNGPYCNPHIGAKSIAKYQAFTSPGNIIELLDRLEAAEKVCTAVTIRLKQHHQSCDYVTHRMIDEPCSCGAWQLNKALAAWQKVKEGQ